MKPCCTCLKSIGILMSRLVRLLEANSGALHGRGGRGKEGELSLSHSLYNVYTFLPMYKDMAL